MESQKVNEIRQRLKVYEKNIEEIVGNSQARDSFKYWSIKVIETLNKEEATSIRPDFEKALLRIDSTLSVKSTLMLFLSKSEILTCLSLISKIAGQTNSAIEFSKRALELNNLITAFISVETDWDFLEFTFEDLDRALKIKGVSIGGAVVERMHKNLPLLIEYYKSIGDKESEKISKERFATICYSEGSALLG